MPGSPFTNLHAFSAISCCPASNSAGAWPAAALVLSDNTLYGTAFGGGNPPGNGSVFAVNADGTNFRTLHLFPASLEIAPGYYTNSDGAAPGGLILSGDILFGVANGGGLSGNGTLFKINIDGTGFTTLHHFGANAVSFPQGNNDGAQPNGLVLPGSRLYGTAHAGGANNEGTVFAMNLDGTGFVTLYSFAARSGSANADGAQPLSGLILVGNTVYGTAQLGGSWGQGTVFKINTDGTGFSTLHVFSGGTVQSGGNTYFDGANPQSALTQAGNFLYGTTFAGGDYGKGTIFSLALQPRLSVHLSETNAILSWSTNAASFTLQSCASLGPATGWGLRNLPGPPSVVGGEYVVRIPSAGSNTHQFYRLIQ